MRLLPSVLFLAAVLPSAATAQPRPAVLSDEDARRSAEIARMSSAPNAGGVGRTLSTSPAYSFAPHPVTPPVVAPMVNPYMGMGMPFGGWGLGGYGAAGRGIGAGVALQGFSSVIGATGQYEQDIQQARITRQEAKRATMETQKQALQLEWWYENQLMQSSKRREDAERVLRTERARRDPPDTEIFNGSTLNILLKSILAAPNFDKGPYLTMEPDTVRGLNFNDGGGKGSLAMAKDEGKILWTEALEDKSYDALRDSFEKNFAAGMKSASEGVVPPRETISALRSDIRALLAKLDGDVGTLSPSAWIESKRALNKLNDAVRGMSDPRTVKANAKNSRAGIRTVSELVTHMSRNGLEFAPAAASGDNPAYRAAYQSLRAYEREVAQPVAMAPR